MNSSLPGFVPFLWHRCLGWQFWNSIDFEEAVNGLPGTSMPPCGYIFPGQPYRNKNDPKLPPYKGKSLKNKKREKFAILELW